MRPRLSDGDLDSLVRITAPHPETDPDALLPWSLLEELRILIPCDAVSVYGHDALQRCSFAMQELTELPESAPEEVFWAHYRDCLDCSYPERTGDLASVTMFSDFYDDLTVLDSGMYQEFMAPSGVRHEIRLCLPAGPGRTLRLIFFRGPGPSFTERDRAILTLLRPHIGNAIRTSGRGSQGIDCLTPRQREVLRLVAEGHSNRQIARQLRLSEGTVHKHLEAIFERLGVSNRTAAAAFHASEHPAFPVPDRGIRVPREGEHRRSAHDEGARSTA
jgi:DNA-binding CsgD family transcriptional regulator